jgi:hypothetical protein
MKSKKSFLSLYFKKLKNSLKIKFPLITFLYPVIKKKQKITFSGWGMATHSTNPPWLKDNSFKKNIDIFNFNIAHNIILNLVKKNKFYISQLSTPLAALEELKWRHYFIFQTVLFSSKFTSSKKKYIVECGVCDGLTAFYAMMALKKFKYNFKSYLYDSWSVMKDEYLDRDEKKLSGSYRYLNLSRTIKNLYIFKKYTTFNRGYIPESFKNSINPKIVSWLHIDLNSSFATLEALNFFWDKIDSGGVIIFDDYGSSQYTSTKKVIDKFFENKSGHFFNLPTGQGVFFKK